jgi:hypothetical protein
MIAVGFDLGAPYGTERKRTETSIKWAFLGLSAEVVMPPGGTTGNLKSLFCQPTEALRFQCDPHGALIISQNSTTAVMLDKSFA